MSHLPDELFNTVISSIPIICVDIIPVRKLNNAWALGVITRATPPQAGKTTILGGRINYGETVQEAIARHLKTDLGLSKYEFLEKTDQFNPFRIQQFLRAETAGPPFGFDPTKHAISLNYLVEITDTPIPKNEAKNFFWINESQIPNNCGYNHDLVIKSAFDFLNQNLN